MWRLSLEVSLWLQGKPVAGWFTMLMVGYRVLGEGRFRC